jgi:hypothetical protein
MKKKNELRLRATDINTLSDSDLIKFIVNRDSFSRDYKLLHGLEKDEAMERFYSVVCNGDTEDLCSEFKVCFKAAIQVPERQTYYFNFFIIDLIERFYSDLVYCRNKKEIRLDQIPGEDDPTLISYEWVLYARVLTPYYRYLLFEYLALGYSIEDLARRRYCTSKTIENHFKQVLDLFGA